VRELALDMLGVVAHHGFMFAFIGRNATPADRHFHIPPERVVEIGTQLDL
jgi:K+ transporter